jgi:hypothetical protein
MVISMTNAVLTNTQAVSPVLTADAAATGVAVTAAATIVAASSARAGKAPANAIPIPIIPAIHPDLFTCIPLSLCCCFKIEFRCANVYYHDPCQVAVYGRVYMRNFL